jgi:hypothetical protein
LYPEQLPAPIPLEDAAEDPVLDEVKAMAYLVHAYVTLLPFPIFEMFRVMGLLLV